ncbi:MAG: nicotinate (nicotinamide) nucleotide adenylyltransferase [Epsilonproteobacteria bacterium]|nr:nicotinate (nicotinamide) nucleotide adenylyltransferase [Campylobacterota bacterium]
MDNFCKRKGAALFGGSFDPPHNGHIEIVKEVLKLPYITQVVIVPTWKNPFKAKFNAPPQKRFEWIKKSFNFKDISISDFEISQNRSVYTIETFKHLRKTINISYIIIGSDNLKDIEKWKDFEELNRSICWIVIKRGTIDKNILKLKHYLIIDFNNEISSTYIREKRDFSQVPLVIKEDVEKFYKGDR